MILGNLINLGVNTEMEFYQKREARMVNLFAWIALIGSLAGITTVFFISAKYPTLIASFSVFTAAAVLLLNYREQYNIATYLFVFTTNVSIFVINQQYIKDVGNYLYYFPLIFCVALVHNPTKSNKRTFVFFIMIAVSFLASWLFDIDSLKNTTVSEQDNHVLFVYNNCFTFFLTLILVYLVVKLINRQNNEALGLLKKEQEAQLIISQSLTEKEILLAEIQHRVKNNLAIITGLLNLQTEKAPCEESRQLMIDSRNRVMSIAMVHERLYRKENLSKINLKEYLSELVQELISSFPLEDKQIKVIEEIDFVEIEITKAVPLGLIINEAITNSIKHAFIKSTAPQIIIKLKRLDNSIKICMADNGIGFNRNQKINEKSLGISLIESLANQIDATLEFKNENGTCLSIEMNL